MTSPAAKLRALAAGLLTVLLLPLAVVAPASAADRTPLTVTIGSLTPSTIPARGTVTVTGRISNTSDETWENLNVYMLTSGSPFTTEEQLAEANASDATLEVGPRLTDPGLFASIGDLPPGSSREYSLSVPRRELQVSGAPGVYWLGVHVLGGNADGRDGVADGRARSFLPLMEPGGPRTTLSIVVPIKGRVRRDADGRLRDAKAWQQILGPDGRLGRLLDFSGTSFGVPLTWVLDPAVLDAAQSVAAENPPMNTGPSDTEGDPAADPSSPPSASPEASGGPSEDATGEGADGDGDTDLSEGAQQATDWLDTFARQAGQHTVMSVPYGDADVASMLRNDFESLYEQAVELSSTSLETLDVAATPVVAPPEGYLPPTAMRELPGVTSVLLADTAAPGADSTVIETENGPRAVLSSTAASAGGPAPTSAYAPLAIRQRVISEAAVHALSDQRDQPLVVSTPQTWDPGPDWRIAQVFDGLDVPWLRTVDLPDVISEAGVTGSDTSSFDGPLRYPRSERRAEIPIPNLLATRELAETGTVFDTLLTSNDTVQDFVAKSALLASSTNARRRPKPALAMARETTLSLRNRMEAVQIDGPSFVTMSSEEGTFAVTVINDLQEPVTVGITAETGSDDLVIDSPEPVSLNAGQRATVRLRATSTNIGVHSVTLVPTTIEGASIGNETRFSVRSSQVGLVIWIIIGIGGAVLLVASGMRIIKRVRARKTTDGPAVESTWE